MPEETNQSADQASAEQNQQLQGGADRTEQKLSDENARWRLKVRDLEAQLKDLQPKAEKFDQQQESQKSEQQKLQERLAALEADLASSKADAERAKQQTHLVRLATQAGVDPEVVDLLDLSKLDLSDDAKALQVLSRFAKTAAGSQVKPGAAAATGETDAELRKRYFGGQSQTRIFGG